MSHEKDKDTKTATATKAAEQKTPTGVKRAKPFDATKAPPRKGDEVDTAKLKELRREKPDEAPVLPGDEGGKPAKIHPLPHEVGIAHPPGEEEETEDKAEAAGADTATPFTDQQAQTLYGLRKEGRLYRCRQAGHDVMLVEADSPEQAREAYVTEAKSRAGEGETEKGKKAPAAIPALPAGFMAVPIQDAPEPVSANKVSVVKLAP